MNTENPTIRRGRPPGTKNKFRKEIELDGSVRWVNRETGERLTEEQYKATHRHSARRVTPAQEVVEEDPAFLAQIASAVLQKKENYKQALQAYEMLIQDAKSLAATGLPVKLRAIEAELSKNQAEFYNLRMREAQCSVLLRALDIVYPTEEKVRENLSKMEALSGIAGIVFESVPDIGLALKVDLSPLEIDGVNIGSYTLIFGINGTLGISSTGRVIQHNGLRYLHPNVLTTGESLVKHFPMSIEVSKYLAGFDYAGAVQVLKAFLSRREHGAPPAALFAR